MFVLNFEHRIIEDFPLGTFSHKSGEKIVFGIGPKIKQKMNTANV